MNIDDLKDAWSNDEPKGMQLPVSTAMLGRTNSVVERVRRNMKSEFFATLISYVIILGFMFGRPLNSFLFNMASMLFFTILVLNCFYFFKFYIFYKSISRYDFSLRESIRKIAYEMELNTEVYKTYNLSVAPIAVLITMTLTWSPETANYLQHILADSHLISIGNMLLIFAIILVSFAITYICFNWHVRLQFGKYLDELKRVVEDLESEG